MTRALTFLGTFFNSGHGTAAAMAAIAVAGFWGVIARWEASL